MTITLENVVVQFLQPYFFFSIAFSAIFFVSVKIFLNYNPCINRKVRSFLLIAPLFTPLIVYLFSFPSTTIPVMTTGLRGNLVYDSNTAVLVPPAMVQESLPQIQFFTGNETIVWEKAVMFMATVPSIVGILCLTGLIVSCVYFGFMLAFGHKIASKMLHVVEISKEEFTTLQQQVQQVSQKMSIKAPKIGVIEELRPNAFTLGHGRNVMMVVSIGLLNNFRDEELTAILAHELAHIKQNDFFFKTACYFLNILLFFNPLSYLVRSQALKERELLADEQAAKLLKKPHLMATTLIKIEKMLQAFPKEHLKSQLSTSIFLISPVAYRPALLATHPPISCRVHNLLNAQPKLKIKPKKIVALTLSLIFIMVFARVFHY